MYSQAASQQPIMFTPPGSTSFLPSQAFSPGETASQPFTPPYHSTFDIPANEPILGRHGQRAAASSNEDGTLLGVMWR